MIKKLLFALAFALLLFAPPLLAATKECESCNAMCEKTIKQIEKKGPKYQRAARLMRDCIKVGKFCDEMKGSEFEGQAEALCADVCGKCAQACEELKDKSLQGCIDECNKCSKCEGEHKSTHP